MLSHFNRCHIKFHTGRKMAWSWSEMNLSSIASRKTDANTSWSSTTPRRRTVGTTRLRPMEASLWLSSWCRVSPPRFAPAAHFSSPWQQSCDLIPSALLVLYRSWGYSVHSCCLLLSAQAAATVDHYSPVGASTSQLLGITNHCNFSGRNSSVNFYWRKHWMSSDNSFFGIFFRTPQKKSFLATHCNITCSIWSSSVYFLP